MRMVALSGSISNRSVRAIWKRVLTWITLYSVSLLLIACGGGAAWSQNQKPRVGDLKEGYPAPDFVVKDVDGKKTVKLSDLKGKPVMLIFGSCT